jgi:archaellum component FlaF (FlaF/FlaG flagellin family)
MRRVKLGGKMGLSPFIATIVLIVASLAIGGLVFTQFRGLVVAGAKSAYIDVIDYTISSNGRTLTLTVKNTGNERLVIRNVLVEGQRFSISYYPTNVLNPGDAVVIRVTRSTGSFPTVGELNVIIVGDKFSRSFNLPL